MGDSAFDRLREYCTVKHHWTIVYDILCIDWDPGEWISFRLSRRFLWQSGKTSTQNITVGWLDGDFLLQFLGAYERYKAYKMATTKNYAPRRLGLIAQIILYLLPGIVIFLFLPSLIFSYFENWSYTVSLYYSFVTLTTIGFGDYVPTFDPYQVSAMWIHMPNQCSDWFPDFQEQNFGFMFHVYEVFIIFWFIFGLGYLVMIMGFIAK